MNATATTRNALIADMEKRLGELHQMLDFEGRVVGSHTWVVVNAIQMPIKFDIEPRTGAVRGAKVTNLEGATRLTRADAQILAAKIKDGRGECGSAMTIVQAIKEQVKDLEELITTVNGA